MERSAPPPVPRSSAPSAFAPPQVRAFERAGEYRQGRTVARATLDLSAFCQAEPLGPRTVTIPLRWALLLPAG